ncbi:MAG: neutral/alkaline non-lysosomal ceramidase N-terminal domain-containing protein [Roseibacillus sp.]
MSCLSRELVLLVAVAIAIPQSHAALRAGTAIVDITPKEWPLPLRGAFHPRIVDSARDPLHVRSLVLDDGKTTIALALVDSCMVHREVLDPAKEQISKATGIAEANIMVCATHTHSAPFSNAIHGTPEERAYQKLLLAGIVESVSSAAGNRQAATIGWGSHELTDEVFNRRWHLKAGKMPANPFGSKEDKVKMNPPRSADVLDRPAGPTDPEVSVLYLKDERGRPLSVFANYSLHYVGNTGPQASADYFGEFARLMQHRLPPRAGNFVAMLSNGTSGDINNINFRNPRPRRAVFEQIGVVASKTADAATHAIKGITKTSGEVKLAMRQREITLKHRVPSGELLERAKKILETPLKPSERKTLERIYAERTLELARLAPDTRVIVQAIRIGDLGICTLPFEVLVEIGLELKKKSPAGDTFVVELANGAYGYLPTPQQHELGGYETWLGTNKVQLDASEILVGNLLEMLNELF